MEQGGIYQCFLVIDQVCLSKSHYGPPHISQTCELTYVGHCGHSF